MGNQRKRAQKIADILDSFLGRPKQSKRRASPLEMLIATLLSQNTNDRNSHQAWLHLRKTFPRWEDVVRARTEHVAKVIEVGGLKNQKARRIKKILKTLREENGSFDLRYLKRKSNDEVFSYLTEFEGIGMKTAACVLLFSLGRDVFPVDTHVHRLCNRLGFVDTKTPDETFEAMKEVVPKRRAYAFHTNLIRFGRLICKAGTPLCGRCPLYQFCRYSEKSIYASRSLHHGKSQRDVNFMLLDHVGKG